MSKPRFRIPSSWISPPAILLVGATYYFFSQDWKSEEAIGDTVKAEFPHTSRGNKENIAQVKEFIRRVRDGDPREVERMDELLKGGRGGVSRQHSTTAEIEAYGFIPGLEESDGSNGGSSAALQMGEARTGLGGKLPEGVAESTVEPGMEGGGSQPRRWWYLWLK